MAVSVITAYQLDPALRPEDAGSLVRTESIPLKDLVDPAVPSDPVRDLNRRNLTDPELVALLTNPQTKAREVAKRIFRLVSVRRSGQMAAAIAEPITMPGQPMSSHLPQDRGHFPGPYYAHVLQGLRASPPAYVADLL